MRRAPPGRAVRARRFYRDEHEPKPRGFYNKRGTAEQWIKEGKQATHWTRLSCHRFRANEVRLQLSVRGGGWDTKDQELVADELTAARADAPRAVWLLFAEGHRTRLFGDMLRGSGRCLCRAGSTALNAKSVY